MLANQDGQGYARFFGLTEYAFTNNCKNDNFHEEATMKETIRSILKFFEQENSGLRSMSVFNRGKKLR
jgi:hypothetical protein